MRTRLCIVSLVGLAIAACTGAASKEALSPPPQAGVSSPPRLDGVYASRIEPKEGKNPQPESWDLIRFLPNGRVMSLSSSAAIENAVALFYDTDSHVAANGTYEVKDGVLRFVLKSKLGAMEYAGAAREDRLAVRWHSSINDATLDEAFIFITVKEAPAEQPDAGDVPTPVPTPPPAAVEAEAGIKTDTKRSRAPRTHAPPPPRGAH